VEDLLVVVLETVPIAEIEEAVTVAIFPIQVVQVGDHLALVRLVGLQVRVTPVVHRRVVSPDQDKRSLAELKLCRQPQLSLQVHPLQLLLRAQALQMFNQKCNKFADRKEKKHEEMIGNKNFERRCHLAI
jgi:hypothetical protein